MNHFIIDIINYLTTQVNVTPAFFKDLKTKKTIIYSWNLLKGITQKNSIIKLKDFIINSNPIFSYFILNEPSKNIQLKIFLFELSLFYNLQIDLNTFLTIDSLKNNFLTFINHIFFDNNNKIRIRIEIAEYNLWISINWFSKKEKDLILSVLKEYNIEDYIIKKYRIFFRLNAFFENETYKERPIFNFFKFLTPFLSFLNITKYVITTEIVSPKNTKKYYFLFDFYSSVLSSSRKTLLAFGQIPEREKILPNLFYS